MKASFIAAQKLTEKLEQAGVPARVNDVPKNEWMSKVTLIDGNICVYSNAKGVISLKTHEIAADQRPKIEALLQSLEKSTPIAATATPEEIREGCLVAYTDGSDQNSQCGWSAVICDTAGGRIQEVSGNIGTQPNKQIGGEVEGAIQAIDLALKAQAKSLEIRHDYQGVGHWARNEWKANDPDARRLQRWAAHARQKGLEMQFTWTRGHNGNPGNERADVLAGQATQKPVTPRIADPDGGILKIAPRAMQAALPGMEM